MSPFEPGPGGHINLRVRYFGRCRELAASDEEWMEVHVGATVADVLAKVMAIHQPMSTLTDQLLVAVNENYAGRDAPVCAGDTIAIFPPVSGGAGEDDFRIVREPIDTPGLVKRMLAASDGAVVSFEGVVRNHSMGKAVLFLEYEAYEEMAYRMLDQIGREVHERWPIDRMGIVHRLGRMEIGETSVAIVVTSAHRRPAFEACHYAIDRLKKIVPIWKREHFEDGVVWVEGEQPCAGGHHEG